MRGFARTIGGVLLGLCAAAGAAEGPSADVTQLFRQAHDDATPTQALEKLEGLLPTLANPAQRDLALAVCAIGRLLRGDDNGAQALRDALKTASPDSRLLRRLTPEAWSAPCPQCKGSGHVTAVCRGCKGDKKCEACQGDGRIQMLGRHQSVCTACGGDGKCHFCGGTGHQKNPCPGCGGAKKLPDKGRMRQTMREMLQAYLDPSNAPKSKPKPAPAKKPGKSAPKKAKKK